MMKTACYIVLYGVLALVSCKRTSSEKGEERHRYTNRLVDESSPYLLQHAHNPVNWYPWGEEALAKARKENKLIIVSIGYAACHWCHVMEDESFENEEVAKFMNEHFVSIKVDREERPDVDQVYMTAVQLLTGRGGWPLNCIALPDGRPVYGGTYFPRAQWLDLLQRIRDFVRDNPEKAEQQATLLTRGLQADTFTYEAEALSEATERDLDSVFLQWKENIDLTYGGQKGAPKFPLPAGLEFLLNYHHFSGDAEALQAVHTTLEKMAGGGIYDQIGGGFARYAVDAAWKVPHFEKMLYDNAQLVSVYAKAYQQSGKPEYKRVVTETLDFVARELSPEEGGFYSSLDADSEGEEGKFYVWSATEFRETLGEKAGLMATYYNVTEEGNWENGHNILHKTQPDTEMAAAYGMTEAALQAAVLPAKEKLLKKRNKRVRPATDDKILTSWNALMLKGYVDAYRALGDKNYLNRALKNARFILENMKTDDGRLYRSYKESKATVNGFLEDYAFTVSAFIALYQATFDEQWLREAQKLTAYTLTHFYDEKSGLFYYTSDLDPELITRRIEVTDNVMPSANSEMAKNLLALGMYFNNDDYLRRSERMIQAVKKDLVQSGPYYANWAVLLRRLVQEPYEVAIVGKDFEARRKELDQYYLPHVFFSGGKDEGTLELLKNKYVPGQTMIYVCRNKSCKLPVTETAAALKQLADSE